MCFQGFKTVIKAALSQYPIEKFTDRFLQAGKPRQIPGSQQLYSYAGVNNIVEPAQILLTKMIEECKRGTNQESSAQCWQIFNIIRPLNQFDLFTLVKLIKEMIPASV